MTIDMHYNDKNLLEKQHKHETFLLPERRITNFWQTETKTESVFETRDTLRNGKPKHYGLCL